MSHKRHPLASPGRVEDVACTLTPAAVSRPRKRKHILDVGSSAFNVQMQERASVQFSSIQSLSSVQLCDPMSRSTPGLPVHHQLQEFTQTHVHQVGDAIQPSHPLSSPSPPAPNPSQYQGLSQ